MIFIVLNAVLAAYLIWASMNVNTKKQGTESIMINVLLLSAAATIAMFITLISIFWGPERIVIIFDHLQIFFIAAIYIELSMMFVSITRKKKSVFSIVVKVILLILAAYISFFKIHVDDYTVFSFMSDVVFSGVIGEKIKITWIELFIGFFVFACPIFSILLMIIKAEILNSRLSIQKTAMCLGSLAFGWIGLSILYYISGMLPMMRALYMFIIGVMGVLIQGVVSQEKIYDGSMIFSFICSIVIRYLVPAILGAFTFVVLRPLYSENATLYSLIVFGSVFFCMVASKFVNSGMSKLINFHSSQYEEQFEKALASIDYENEAADIAQEVLKAFSENMQTSAITVLVDNGLGDYTTAYSSKEENYVIAKSHKAFDTLMNNDIHILFKEELETNYIISDVKADIQTIFDETDSSAMIILHEGHHILGLLMLSEKRTGSGYDEYDKNVLDRFYSYFFVFGYYMKNIANASVVGTVNREIRMSSQIITSIQENMDYIKNPKIDVGYLMVPAHNIGGEFVDLIRLNNTSHILVIGSLSGKGISASMSMVILKSIIRTFLVNTHDFKKLIQKVNAFIRFNLPSGTFFSGLFCLIDFATDTMYYVNSGISTLLQYSKAYNNVIEIQGKGYVLGFVKDVSPLIKVKQVKLSSGDMFAISTAGLINSHSLRGEQFGKESIKQCIMDNYTYPSSRIAKFTYDQLQRFMSKELEDDITMVVLKYYGKDAALNIDADANVNDESVADFSDDIDVDSLLQNAVDESIKDSASEQEAENSAEETIVVESPENSLLADISDIIETDFDEDDDMFNADFSNPNDVEVDIENSTIAN